MHNGICGATSSLAVVSSALRKAALDKAIEFSPDAVDKIEKPFYVGDGLKAVAVINEAISLVAELTVLTQNGRFHLTGWLSNS